MANKSSHMLWLEKRIFQLSQAIQLTDVPHIKTEHQKSLGILKRELSTENTRYEIDQMLDDEIEKRRNY